MRRGRREEVMKVAEDDGAGAGEEGKRKERDSIVG